jgi:transcriptional regulator with XRE-family HTH domain
MTLRQYLTKYRITIEEFAFRCGVTPAAIWNYLSGRRKPFQKVAEKIEQETDGLVTVFIMRGKDDRRKDPVQNAS